VEEIFRLDATPPRVGVRRARVRDQLMRTGRVVSDRIVAAVCGRAGDPTGRAWTATMKLRVATLLIAL
jgi:hypothetical protein